MTAPTAIILFDGVCNLCNGFVQFVIQHDPQGHFRFASLQSATGQALLAEHGLTLGAAGPETVMLVEQNRIFTHSTAVLRIARQLGGAWMLLYAFIVVPKVLRDAAYRFVARHRYQWFGQREACMLPTPNCGSAFWPKAQSF
ncbi:thiol-disulfide oxidoreductase DCC family protein [Hymenobacter cellulosilyticus]|uniref:Thiol-disulfide oxidoreductase DCC family protein n=1 Tax=Hymenobacter cellulosilyticus TaxID=2932248 RepID=A0A8T9QAH8_9BACT|nr:thiol-disulfide oxidoreductase DCC family protein [Hymenobacter cellulosilyticus]UOQ71893.1 thiol-disulfide oxidoreductase DCC family protein [Hymenobacter cellulosilyticus]